MLFNNNFKISNICEVAKQVLITRLTLSFVPITDKITFNTFETFL